jgi:hypothetical protein
MTNKPIETFHAGTTEVSVWENQGEECIFHSVTAKRSYRDTDGEWKDAGTVHLLPQQIPDLILALQKSHEFLRMGLQQRRKQQTPPNDNPSEAATSEPQTQDAGSVEHQDTFSGKESERRRGSAKSR